MDIGHTAGPQNVPYQNPVRALNIGSPSSTLVPSPIDSPSRTGSDHGASGAQFIGNPTQLPQPNPHDSPFAISCILLSISAPAEAEKARDTRRFDGSTFAEKRGLFTRDVPSHISL